jgi:hypothetical protein
MTARLLRAALGRPGTKVRRRWVLSLVVVALTLIAVFVPASAMAADVPPTITSIAPASGPAAGGNTVIITGSDFALDATTVMFGDVAATGVTVDSETQITAIAPGHDAGTVNIVVTTAAGSSADSGADDYAYEAAEASEAPPSMTRYDHTDSRISYSGTWAAFTKPDAYHGSYGRSSVAGASVTIVFEGERLDWIAMKGTTTGKADVWLDGHLVNTIDLANAVAIYQQNVWSTGTLPAGVHTVKIVRSAGNITGKYVTIDAVDVDGTLLGSSRMEQGDSRLAYTGTWTTASSSAYSAGAHKYAKTAGASVTVSFSGRYLAWIERKSPGYGIAKVTLDGTKTYTVDLYSPTTVYQQRVWHTDMLPEGTHTIKIEWTGTKNPASTGTTIAVDAFDILGSPIQALVWNRYEQSDTRLLYFGTWSTVSGSGASGGSDKRSNTSSGSLTVTFTGRQLDWIATMGPEMGKADVSLDGGAAVTVDLLSADTLYQQKVWSTGMLTAGTHKLEISWNEENASGAYINVDALDVLGVLPWSVALTPSEIRWAEQRLTDLSYRPGSIDGVIDTRTRGAIIAFQKWEGLTRDGQLSAAVWSRLQTAGRPKPAKAGATSPWIEVNKTKQVLLYCKDGAVVWTLPVSTGSASVGIATPSGTFSVRRKTLETNPRYMPLYISTTLLAIHGYPNVPTYPASHGCVRTHLWDQDALYPLIPVGTKVYIY